MCYSFAMRQHHHLKQWDKWLSQGEGANLLAAEKHVLAKLLPNYLGNFLVLLGVPSQKSLMTKSPIPQKLMITPVLHKPADAMHIEGGWDELPIQTACVDCVVLAHTLEYGENPQRLLTESCRIVKPEGFIMVIGFNPLSLFALKKYFMKKKDSPWSQPFVEPMHVKKWLQLADFEIVCFNRFLFLPPRKTSPSIFHTFIEAIGATCLNPFCNLYILVGKAKVLNPTRMRLHWKQKISDVRIGTTIARPTIRASIR